MPLTERTDLTRLEPARNTMEVEGVIAHTPSDSALRVGRRDLVRLALDASTNTISAIAHLGDEVRLQMSMM